MDFDIFFSSPRWKILEIIAKNPSSPVEISQKLQTSVSYVSQQIKLLEAANIVKKERTGLVEKGKPRNIFSIAKEILPLTVLMNGLPAKKLIHLTPHHKIILKIWMLKNPELHYYLEKLYWKIEDEIENVQALLIDISKEKPKFLIVANSKKLKPKIDAFLKEHKDKLDSAIISIEEAKKIPEQNLLNLHDPNFLLAKKEMKGGLQKDNEI